MTTVRISNLRDNLAEVGNRVALRDERFVIVRRGKRLFAMVPVQDLDLLERMEDRMDLELARERMREPSEPLDKVKHDLGL